MFRTRAFWFFLVVATALTGSRLELSRVSAAEIRESVSEDEINWAKEREFWSFTAPRPQARPAVQQTSWPRQPLDYFILARMEAARVRPAKETDRRTLIRRVTFDLTGLPPTPEEIAAFLADRRSNAYERLVDRLLASPRFGERMASLWLPLARYAEDQAHQVGGDTKDFYPNAYKYRAWVIEAFNRDLPYDQFLKLQLAADKIGTNDASNLPALGFLGLGPKYYNRGRLDVMALEWEDRVDTVTRTMLGLTVACARCHDHKFDPITMSDYYALAGVFASTKMVNKSGSGKTEEPKAKADTMSADTLHIVEDGTNQDLNVFIRGNVERKGPVVERRFLRVLSEAPPVRFKEGSGRRDLAEAIADRRNPLTARVMANRLWGVCFGRPLVATPSNFGHSGEPPSHPELLDDLAGRFMEEGWSVKTLAREMVLSATYRQSSMTTAELTTADPDNRWFSRMSRRRLTVEQWRDAALFDAGDLQWGGGLSQEADAATNHLRTVYARMSRFKLNDLLGQFDYPDANVHAERRAVTTTPTQKLFLLNSPFMLAAAGKLSARLNKDQRLGEKEKVRRAYALLFGREPARAELKLALEFLRQPPGPGMPRWERYAQILLASNEMMYVD